MQLLFETRTELRICEGHLSQVYRQPTWSDQPVLRGDCSSDAAGASLYGTVLRDSGVYRMWYQCWPETWSGQNVAAVGYAESDDGLAWSKRELNLVTFAGNTQNHLCNLGLSSPSVWVDPAAPSTHRFRATGYGSRRSLCGREDIGKHGYYGAHSPDGLHWELDQPTPIWYANDVVNSIYHPQQKRGIAAYKVSTKRNGTRRRAVWSASFDNQAWSQGHAVLIPDAFDDHIAAAQGYGTADYYGMAMLPAGRSTVGFLWRFHKHNDKHGEVDISLAYQMHQGDCWLHAYGRKEFLSHADVPWAQGGLYSASCPVEVGDEHWLYLSGAKHSHGWHLDVDEAGGVHVVPERLQRVREEGARVIGVSRWPKYQLFGMQAHPHGVLVLDDQVAGPGRTLVLNHDTEAQGRILVEIESNGRIVRHRHDCQPIDGMGTQTTVCWKDGRDLGVPEGERFKLRLIMDRATVYAFDLL